MSEEKVNHPTHYLGECSLECIDVMEVTFGGHAVLDFCFCNAFKYMWRHKYKKCKEDLDKVNWYLCYADGLIKRLGLSDTDESVAVLQRLKHLFKVLIFDKKSSTYLFEPDYEAVWK